MKMLMMMKVKAKMKKERKKQHNYLANIKFMYSECSTNGLISVIICVELIMFHLVIRVAEDWPLYDILNQFRNGQSHMAVVLKCEENIRTAATEREGKTPGLIIHKQFTFKISTNEQVLMLIT